MGAFDVYIVSELLEVKVPMVKTPPVNYAIRSSGPVTALTARRVWYGVGAPSICQADLLARL
jgi:hypothetical protein